MDAWKHWLKQFRWSRPLRLALQAYRARSGGYPDWPALLGQDWDAWRQIVGSPPAGKRILIATSVGSHLPSATLESLLAVALRLRGADVRILLCDAALPACMAADRSWYPDESRFVKHGSSLDLCRHCFEPGARLFEGLGFPVIRYSRLVPAEFQANAERQAAAVPFEEIPGFRLDGLPVGEHALAGALRYYARGTLDGEPNAEPVLRRYFRAALLTTYATQRLFQQERFDAAVFNHGIYVPQGLIGEVARAQNVRVVNWNPAYRKRCFIFSHGDTYHHTLVDEPISNWDSLPLDSHLERHTLAYLKSRRTGDEDWITFHRRAERGSDLLLHELGIDPAKSCIGLLTNVVWDAQLHYSANAFPGMIEWLLKTIGYFVRRPDLQLLIRVHPAEVNSGLRSRQKALDEIGSRFPRLPPNVLVIPPESPISTYAAMERCNAVIIYGTKTGVELTSLGIPVIVAGEAWIRNKGLTLDAASESDYFQLLDRLPLSERLDDNTRRRARKYAFHFFFRRMIPLGMMEPAAGWPPYRVRVRGLADLKQESDPGLDVICDGILEGSEFIYPAERYLQFASNDVTGVADAS